MWRRRRKEEPVDLPLQRWVEEHARDSAEQPETADWLDELRKRGKRRRESSGDREEDLPVELQEFLRRQRGR